MTTEEALKEAAEKLKAVCGHKTARTPRCPWCAAALIVLGKKWNYSWQEKARVQS